MRAPHSVWTFLMAAPLAACASTPGPSPGPDSPPATTAVTPIPQDPSPPSPPAATAAPVASGPPETGCFASPLTMPAAPPRTKPAPVDTALARTARDCEKKAEIEDCRFWIAKDHFQSGRYGEAGPMFRALALNGTDMNVAPYAAQLYLDALNHVGVNADPARPECLDEMSASTPKLMARFCGKNGAAVREISYSEELCPTLLLIDVEVKRLSIERLVQQADRGGADSIGLYRRAADGYMQLFDERCKHRRPSPGKRAEPPPGWSAKLRCEELGYNAMRAYMAIKDMPLARAARALLTDPDNGLSRTELTKKAASYDLQ